MFPIQCKVDSGVAKSPAKLREQLTLQGVDHREIPTKDVKAEVWIAFEVFFQDFSKRKFFPGRSCPWNQANSGIDVPGEDEDALFGFFQSTQECGIVTFGINQQAGLPGMRDFPAILPGPEKWLHRT